MSTEQLPGLQMAVNLLAQIGDDESDRAIAAVHAACDLAQRVADLEAITSAPRGTYAQIKKEREIAAASIDGALAFGYQGCSAPEAGHWLLGAHNAGARIADLETKCATLKRLHDAAADERDALRARLAEIEAQEPVCHLYLTDYRGYANIELQGWEDLPIGEHKLYARPGPAQAAPDADGARFRWLCEDHSDRETRERCRRLIDRLPVMSYSDAVMSIDAAMAAAPEHKA